ncbi:MAG: YopT-type cysteine protease domain-containing protein [Gammaproteobacteria bacterium]|nr:YopT-type cysteine protease domain-containing protein [Gammaproteobacteria bacterium]
MKAALAKQDAAEGVCRELAVRWLAAKQRGEDDTFLNALLGLGGSVKEEELKKVVEAFKAIGDKNIVEQRTYTETQLKLHFHSVAKTEVLYGPSRIDVGPKVAAVDWLFSPAERCEFRFFGIRGIINHATAVSLAPGKESFSDPNLGEFEFTNKPDKLENFLNKHIFPAGGDGRGKYIGRKEFYDIERICCA